MFQSQHRHAQTPVHETALACLEAGIDAANPSEVIPKQLTYDPDGDQLMITGEL